LRIQCLPRLSAPRIPEIRKETSSSILQPPPSSLPAHAPQPPLRRSNLFPWSGPLTQVNNRDVGRRCSQASSREEAHQVQQSAAWGWAQHVRGMLRLSADAYPSPTRECNAIEMLVSPDRCHSTNADANSYRSRPSASRWRSLRPPWPPTEETLLVVRWPASGAEVVF
jgi:hypothetical protein